MTAPALPLRRPQSVLFACSLNTVRSPMAEAIGRHLFGRSIYFASAGVATGEIDPFAVAVMEEVGLNLLTYHPRAFEDLHDASFDLIVTLSDDAHDRALALTRTLAAEVIHWPTADASAFEGSRAATLYAYRGVRDHLTRLIANAFGR